MVREAVLLDLVGRVYAAAEDPRLWNDFLAGVSKAVGGRLAAFASEDLRAGHASIGSAVGFEDAPSRAYENYYAAKNVWMAAALKRAGTGDLVTSQILVPDREFIRTEYYADFLRKLNLRHLLGAVMFRETGRVSHLSILREGPRGEFGASEVRVLRLLIPHLQRGIQLHTAISAFRAERDALHEVLDRVPIGVLLLDGSGRALLVNRTASEIFAMKQGLSFGREGIAASVGQENRRLRRLISQATTTGAGLGTNAGGVLSITRPSGGRPFSLLVTPLTAKDSATFGGLRPAAVIFVTDPERSVRTDRGILRELYGFTPAETTLACKLVAGESVEEAADELEITINTARTHVRHLLEKTDTHTHRELIRILLLGCAQIRA